MVMRALQQIILIPILIAAWGTDLYQDWLVVFSAAAMLSILDGGMQVFFSNLVTAAFARGERTTYRRIFGAALTIYCVVVVIAAAGLIVGTVLLPLPALLNTRVMNPSTVTATFDLMAVANLVLLPIGVLMAAYRAHGDYAFFNVFGICADLVRGFGICVVALSGGAATYAAIIYLVVSILLWIAVILHQHRRYGEVPVALVLPTGQELRDYLYGSTLYMVPAVIGPMVLNAPVLLLSSLGAADGAVVAYTVARTLTGVSRQIVHMYSHPIGQELARQRAGMDHAAFRRLFFGAGRLMTGFGALVGGITIVGAAPAIALWTHNAVASDPWLITCFVVTVILTAPGQVSLLLLYYDNAPITLIVAHAAFGLGALGFCTLLIPLYSATGAAAGTGIAEILAFGLLLPYFAAERTGLSIVTFLGQSLAVAVAAFPLSYGIAWVLQRFIVTTGWVGLIELAVIWSAIMAPPSFFLLLATRDREWALARIRAAGAYLATILHRQPI